MTSDQFSTLLGESGGKAEVSPVRARTSNSNAGAAARSIAAGIHSFVSERSIAMALTWTDAAETNDLSKRNNASRQSRKDLGADFNASWLSGWLGSRRSLQPTLRTLAMA